MNKDENKSSKLAFLDDISSKSLDEQKVLLAKLTVPELKDILRKHKFRVGGNKSVLIERIIEKSIYNNN